MRVFAAALAVSMLLAASETFAQAPAPARPAGQAPAPRCAASRAPGRPPPRRPHRVRRRCRSRTG